jgi:hypothetical protein
VPEEQIAGEGEAGENVGAADPPVGRLARFGEFDPRPKQRQRQRDAPESACERPNVGEADENRRYAHRQSPGDEGGEGRAEAAPRPRRRRGLRHPFLNPAPGMSDCVGARAAPSLFLP